MSQNHHVEVFHDGERVYYIGDVQQVPSIGHQLDLRATEAGEPGHMYTVVGVTWDLGRRSVELEVELTSAMPA